MDTLLKQAKESFKKLQKSKLKPDKELKEIIATLSDKYPNKFLSEQLGISVKSISNWKARNKQKNKKPDFIQVPITTLSPKDEHLKEYKINKLTFNLSNNINLSIENLPFTKLIQLISNINNGVTV